MDNIDCLPEAGDIVTLPMRSVSLVVAYSSMLFPKLFQAPHSSSRSPLDHLSPFGRLAPLEAMRLFPTALLTLSSGSHQRKSSQTQMQMHSVNEPLHICTSYGASLHIIYNLSLHNTIKGSYIFTTVLKLW